MTPYLLLGPEAATVAMATQGFSSGASQAKDQGGSGFQSVLEGAVQSAGMLALGKLAVFKPLAKGEITTVLSALKAAGGVVGNSAILGSSMELINILGDAIIMDGLGNGKSRSWLKSAYDAHYGKNPNSAALDTALDAIGRMAESAGSFAAMGLLAHAPAIGAQYLSGKLSPKSEAANLRMLVAPEATTEQTQANPWTPDAATCNIQLCGEGREHPPGHLRPGGFFFPRHHRARLQPGLEEAGL